MTVDDGIDPNRHRLTNDQFHIVGADPRPLDGAIEHGPLASRNAGADRTDRISLETVNELAVLLAVLQIVEIKRMKIVIMTRGLDGLTVHFDDLVGEGIEGKDRAGPSQVEIVPNPLLAILLSEPGTADAAPSIADVVIQADP